MNCFQVIKSVLEQEYNQIPGCERQKDAAIRSALKQLREYHQRLLLA
jgi:hypothetical protein